MWNYRRPPLLLAASLLLSSPVAAAAPKTVLDYYLLLPPKYLSALSTTKDRLSLISLKDVKNGYLELSGNWEGDAHMVLWTNTAGQTLVGVSQTECGPVCRQTLWFLTVKDGKWTDVTAKTFPSLSEKTMLTSYNRVKAKTDPIYHSGDELPFLYILPRYGSSVKLMLDPSFASVPTTLADFKFDRATMKFVNAAGARP